MKLPGRSVGGGAEGVEALLRSVEKRLQRIDKRLAVTEQNSVRQIGLLDYPPTEIRIGVTSRMELLSRVRPVHKEPWTVAWIERTLRDGDVFWDIGANVGGYALIAGSIAREGTRVVAVEPAYANYAALCDNIALNGLGDVVMPLPVLLSDATGLATLSLTDLSAGAGVHTLEGIATQFLPTVERQIMLCYALDDLVEQFELPWPTLLKVDVDGAEEAVLAGASRALARSEFRSALVEVEDRLSDAVIAQMERGGLTLRERIDNRSGKPLPGFWYGIFERA